MIVSDWIVIGICAVWTVSEIFIIVGRRSNMLSESATRKKSSPTNSARNGKNMSAGQKC